MEIVFYEDDRSIHGVLDRRLGYSIEARTKKGVTGYYSVRKVPYNPDSYADSRHAQFMLLMARMAVNVRNPLVKDIRVTVRELVDAHVSLVCGSPLAYFAHRNQAEVLREYCTVIGMRLRKVKASSVLRAKDVIGLKSLLERRW